MKKVSASKKTAPVHLFSIISRERMILSEWTRTVNLCREWNTARPAGISRSEEI